MIPARRETLADAGVPPGQQSYSVMLKLPEAEPSTDGEPSRQAISNSVVAASEAFRSAYLSALVERGMSEQLSHIGRAVGMPFIEIVCTPAAAKVAESIVGVAAVLADRASQPLFKSIEPVT